jgi:branched-chain amino acid transport system permease protein
LFVVLLPEGLRMIGLPSSQASNIRQIIYGIALILVMRFRPQGIAGENRF